MKTDNGALCVFSSIYVAVCCVFMGFWIVWWLAVSSSMYSVSVLHSVTHQGDLMTAVQ